MAISLFVRLLLFYLNEIGCLQIAQAILYICISSMKKGVIFFMLLCLAFLSKAQTPTEASTNLVFGNKYCSEVNLSWDKGNGVSRIVIASKNTAVSVLPNNNTFYLPSSIFGNGHSFSATEFVVYNGTGNSVIVTNLEKNTTYFFAVFEYNGAGTVFNYLTTVYPESSTTTENIQADFVPNDAYQCENVNDFTFTPNVVQTGAGTLTYAWRFGDGTTSTAQVANHVYTVGGIYDVQLTVKSYQCETIVVKKDTVAPSPEVSFILDPAVTGNTAEQCFLKPDGSSNYFKFTNTSRYGFLPTGYSYTEKKWDFGDGQISFNIDDNFVNKTYLNPGVYTVRFTVDNTFNDREYCTDSFEMEVIVRPRTIDTTKVIFDSAMCIDGNLFEFDHQTNDATVISLWNFGDGNAKTGNTVNHTYTAISKYYIQLEATDGAGCYDVYKDSLQVVPQPNNTIGSASSRFCEGDTPVQLEVTIPNGKWIGDAVNEQGVFTPTILGLNVLKYAVDVSGCRDTAELITTVYERPFFELGSDTTICQGDTFEKSVEKGSATILWSTGSTDSFSLVSKSGILWAELGNNGCVYRDSIIVRSIEAPMFDLGSDSTLCGGSFRQLDVSASDATYTWSDGFEGPLRLLDKSGKYGLTVTNKCGTFVDSVTLDFLPFACDIFIPNAFSPNGDGINDVFRPSGNVTIKSMKIYNRWGEQVYESSADDFSWNGYYMNELAKSDHYFFVILYEKPVPNGAEQLQSSGSVFLMR